jgi:hypothetical protein
MSGKSDYAESAVLAMFLNATPLANMLDNAASSPLTSLYISLHTADPTDAGSQTTSEAAYTGYTRMPIVRSNSSPAWTITGTNPTSASPNANVDFPQCTAVPGAALTYFAIGTAASGAGHILYAGPISPTITVAVGVIPRIGTGSAITED